MPTTLNFEAYCELIDGDLVWLLKQPRSLERDHIEAVLMFEKKRRRISKALFDQNRPLDKDE